MPAPEFNPILLELPSQIESRSIPSETQPITANSDRRYRMPTKLAITLLAFCCVSASAAYCPASSRFEAAIPPGRGIFMVGERHGTNELPELAWQIVCTKLRAGGSVIVALEIPSDEQPRIQAFLASPDTDKGAEQELLKGKFWRRPLTTGQDGRSSKAVFELLKNARAARTRGAPIGVAAVDMLSDGSELPGPLGINGNERGYQRDLTMMRNIVVRWNSHPDFSIVALLGVVHASKTIGTPWDSNAWTAGWALSHFAPVFAVGYKTSKEGASWNCRRSIDRLDCRSHLTRVDELELGPFDLIVEVDHLSASPPAVEQ